MSIRENFSGPYNRVHQDSLAEATVLVCREMCIPGNAQLFLTLPIKSLPPARDVRTIDLFIATRKSLPRPVVGNWRFSLAEAKDSFVLTANLGHQITQAIFFCLPSRRLITQHHKSSCLQPLAFG